MDTLTDSDPTQLGPIRLLGRLGSGGMGQVYLGQTEDGERVAAKMIGLSYQDNPEIRARFTREAQAMGMVQGPGTAALIAHSGPDIDAPWLAMEYVPGLDLNQYVRRDAPLEPRDAIALTFLLAEALADIHQVGLLHRDLKPGNVMLGPHGPQVIDFGLVAIGAPGGEHTASHQLLGTVQYMAPEQVHSVKDVTAAADVYALGPLLLFATTGRYPYPGQYHQALYAVGNPDIAPDLTGLPEELTSLVTALMAYDPAERPDLGELRIQLSQRLAAAGLSPSAARNQLARRTYIPDPEEDKDTAPTAIPTTRAMSPEPRTIPAGPAAAGMAAAAARMRTAYAPAVSW